MQAILIKNGGGNSVTPTNVLDCGHATVSNVVQNGVSYGCYSSIYSGGNLNQTKTFSFTTPIFAENMFITWAVFSNDGDTSGLKNIYQPIFRIVFTNGEYVNAEYDSNSLCYKINSNGRKIMELQVSNLGGMSGSKYVRYIIGQPVFW